MYLYLLEEHIDCHIPFLLFSAMLPSEFKVNSIHPDYWNAEPQFAFFFKHAVCQPDHRIASIEV